MSLTVEEIVGLFIPVSVLVWKAARSEVLIRKDIDDTRVQIKQQVVKQQEMFLENFETLQRHHLEKIRELWETVDVLKNNDAATYSFRKEVNKDLGCLKGDIAALKAQIYLLAGVKNPQDKLDSDSKKDP